MLVGGGFTSRALRLANPGVPGPLASRSAQVPGQCCWAFCGGSLPAFSRELKVLELLTRLALGTVVACPFTAESPRALKQMIVLDIAAMVWKLERHVFDRADVSIDNRFTYLVF